jgi:hypothetical protein
MADKDKVRWQADLVDLSQLPMKNMPCGSAGSAVRALASQTGKSKSAQLQAESVMANFPDGQSPHTRIAFLATGLPAIDLFESVVLSGRHANTSDAEQTPALRTWQRSPTANFRSCTQWAGR